jgi:NAD(P)-dependent dehydrogenase (short-subunit alcohol dehydrogenase family)
MPAGEKRSFGTRLGHRSAKTSSIQIGPVVNLVGRSGLPIDLARSILFLMSDDAEFISAAHYLSMVVVVS